MMRRIAWRVADISTGRFLQRAIDRILLNYIGATKGRWEFEDGKTREELFREYLGRGPL